MLGTSPSCSQWCSSSTSPHKGRLCGNTMEKQPVPSKRLRTCPWATHGKASEPLVLGWSRWLSAVGRAEQMPWVQPASINAVQTKDEQQLCCYLQEDPRHLHPLHRWLFWTGIPNSSAKPLQGIRRKAGLHDTSLGVLFPGAWVAPNASHHNKQLPCFHYSLENKWRENQPCPGKGSPYIYMYKWNINVSVPYCDKKHSSEPHTSAPFSVF